MKIRKIYVNLNIAFIVFQENYIFITILKSKNQTIFYITVNHVVCNYF